MIPWHPIDTLPLAYRDQPTRVLLWLGAPWSQAEVAEWCPRFETWVEEQPEAGFDDEPYGIGQLIPTHWAPIDAPAWKPSN